MTSVQDMTQLADAWVLSTYRRLDVLDVPAFNVQDTAGLVPERTSRPARLHRLPTALPREILSLADWLGGDDVDTAADLSDLARLSLLFRYLASPLRYEPDNVYQVHRAVPSARCVFPLDLFLSHADRDGVRRTYQYHADFHALEEINGPGMRDEDGAGARTAITGVGRFWKVVRKYGDFSPFPVMLEAGMVLAQLRNLRGALGWTGTGSDTGPMRAYCEGDLEVPIFAETIEQPTFDIAALPTCDVMLAGHVASTANVPHFERLSFFMDLFDRPSGPASDTSADVASPLEPGLVPLGLGFLETLRLRHSANDRVGMAPRMDSEAGLLHRFAQLSRRVGRRRGRLPGEERINVVMLWPGRVAPEAGIYDGEGRLLASLDRRYVATTLNRALPSPDLRYNLQAHSVLVLFLADPHAGDMREPHAFRDAHVAAGVLAQDYCVSAAAFGQFARPVRMLLEQVLESALPIRGRIIYSLLCGSSRATNVCAELL